MIAGISIPRYLLKVTHICLIFLIISFCLGFLTPAIAEECCTETDPITGWVEHTWYCIIDGEEIECRGTIEFERHMYDCSDDPENCSGCDDPITFLSYTGNQMSENFLCDGLFAMCPAVVQDPITGLCRQICVCY